MATPEPETAVELKLSELQGEVEVRRADGEWTKANVGQALSTADTVRTLDGAYAVLVGGEAYEIRMEPGTEVSVSELTHSISRLLLGRGMAQAKVKAGAQHTFEVRAAGSDATARTTGGSFAISNNGAGTVAVGTQDGEVEFFGSGKTVIVRAGQQSIVRPGRGPTEPTAIPSSLLLKVKWPTERELRRKTLVVSGEAEPGTQVTIAGRTAAVGADGRFAHKLELAEGKNPIADPRALRRRPLRAAAARRDRRHHAAPRRSRSQPLEVNTAIDPTRGSLDGLLAPPVVSPQSSGTRAIRGETPGAQSQRGLKFGRPWLPWES